MAPQPQVVLRLKRVTVRYDDAVALDAVNLELRAGETCVILGAAGSGKTVLLLTLLAARLAAHPVMGALLLDTKGDLANDGYFDNRECGFKFSFHDLLQAAGVGMLVRSR